MKTVYVDRREDDVPADESEPVKAHWQIRLLKLVLSALPVAQQKLEDALYHIEEAEEAADFADGDAEGVFAEWYDAEEAREEMKIELGRAKRHLMELFHGEA